MMRQTLFWTPRILTIFFAVFLSVFALDVFEHGKGAGTIAIALFMHLLPSILLLLVLAIAWRHPIFGAAAFLCLGALYIGATWGRFIWTVYVAIAGPLLVAGALFLANWISDRRQAVA